MTASPIAPYTPKALTRLAFPGSFRPISLATRLPHPTPNRFENATFSITIVSVIVVAAIM